MHTHVFYDDLVFSSFQISLKSPVYRSNDMISTNFWIDGKQTVLFFLDIMRWRESAMCYVHTIISNKHIDWPSWICYCSFVLSITPSDVLTIVYAFQRYSLNLILLVVSIYFTRLAKQSITRFKNEIKERMKFKDDSVPTLLSIQCLWLFLGDYWHKKQYQSVDVWAQAVIIEWYTWNELNFENCAHLTQPI